jgi:hypothetical protein
LKGGQYGHEIEEEGRCQAGEGRQEGGQEVCEASMSAKHPGFKSVAKGIAAKEGVSQKAAGAILANATRHASPAAKKANPNLKKVK